MIYAVPKTWFSGNFVVQRDGRTLCDMYISQATLRRLFDGAPVFAFHLEGLDYLLSAQVASSALPLLVNLQRLVLTQDGREIAWAVPFSLDHYFSVHWDGRQVDLKSPSWMWQRKIHLLEGGAEIGMIHRGYFSRRTVFELSSDVAPAVQMFMLWLALSCWKKSAAAIS